MLLHEIVDYAARRAPGTSALVTDTSRHTFAGLADRVRRLAVGLRRHTDEGDRVAVLAGNRAEYVECYYGVPAAGRVLTFLNARLTPDELAAVLADAAPSVLLGESSLLDRLLPHADRFPSVRHVVDLDDPARGDLAYDALLADDPDDEAPPGPSDDDVAWLIYTSGTTGAPKGAMLTHRNVVAAVLNTALSRPVAPDDVYLFPFPLYHVAGYNLPLLHLHARPVVLAPRFEPTTFCDQVAFHRATLASLAPTMIGMLLDHPATSTADLSSLRSISYGASAIPLEVLRRGLDELGCDFAQGFGMTELAGNAAFLSAEDHRRGAAGDTDLLAAAGRPGPLAAIRVVDDAMRDVETGEPGEIVVRGDQVTVGYWNSPEATAAAKRGGWFHTGDVGRIDERGYLSVVDRKKDVIVTGGENVASREVEDVLHRHPGVREVAVVGVPDERWGERVCAVVVRRDDHDVSADDLVELVRAHLAGFKKPREVVFVDDLPKNASGKILKARLREQLGRP